MLVFCLPHQFIPNICRQLRDAKVIGAGAFAVSLTKGVDVSGDKIKIIADVIEEELGISCAALSGANIANEGKSSPVVLFTHSLIPTCDIYISQLSHTYMNYFDVDSCCYL
jgi:glycerol-3-phosphate dehydrogenase